MNRQGRQLVRCRQIVTITSIIMSTVVSGIQILLGKLKLLSLIFRNQYHSDG